MKNKFYCYRHHILVLFVIISITCSVILSVRANAIKQESEQKREEIVWHIGSTKKIESTSQNSTTQTTEKNTETSTSKLVGKFKITVYCACEKCCGVYAHNRPIDENGNVIVKGAAGRELVPFYSIAVDPRVIPYGTEVTIDGKTYRADDTGGMVKGKVIDIYAGTDHKIAWKVATELESQYMNVYWK